MSGLEVGRGVAVRLVLVVAVFVVGTSLAPAGQIAFNMAGQGVLETVPVAAATQSDYQVTGNATLFGNYTGDGGSVAIVIGKAATTTAVTLWPGRTRWPVLTPVISTVGGTASTTVTVIGAAEPVCPLVSAALASMVNVVPGTTVAGTSKANVVVRSVTAGVTGSVPAVRVSPVFAR